MATKPVGRRTVLGVAIAGGAGVAAARLLGLRRVVEVDPPRNTASAVAKRSALDWVSPLGNEQARVAHLLRRTTLGYTSAELETALADGYARTVDRLLETPPAEPPPLAGAEEASANKPLRIGDLQSWWLDWALATPTPFGERMTLFWHGLFTSDYRKVGLQSPFIYWQDLTWRRFFLRDLGSILYEMTTDPAMLRYLDLSTSTGADPNENFSRELLELFTLGTGNFTEDDVKAAAKALAGWREPRTAAMVAAQIEQTIKRTGSAPRDPPRADTVRSGIFDRQRAYRGPDLTLLGVRRQWDTRAVLDRILEQDAAAPFMVRKVLDEFVSPSPGDATVKRLADRFRASRYDMRALLADVLRGDEFMSSYRTLVRTPVEFAVASAKALGAPQLAKVIVQQSGSMGQALFDPPSVGGWPTNAGWISSNTMLARINFVTAAVSQVRVLPSAALAHTRFLDSTLSAPTLALLDPPSDDRRRWTAILCSPEFQLK